MAETVETLIHRAAQAASNQLKAQEAARATAAQVAALRPSPPATAPHAPGSKQGDHT